MKMALNESFLMTLFSQPTAPFREHCVRRLIETRLLENNYPYFQDPFGNLLLGADSPERLEKILQSPSRSVSLFVAHMDHPGFHIPKIQNLKASLDFVWHGGSPTQDLKGAEFYVSNLAGHWSPARILKAKLHPSKRYLESGSLKILHPHRLKGDNSVLFGGYHFSRFVWNKGDLIYTKAADDLAGVFALVEACLNTQKRKIASTPIGLLTIAEEVGWVGALAHFKHFKCWKQAKAHVVAISLEASRTLERARHGHGPVVRLGDKASIFDAALSERLIDLAAKATSKKFQKRVMDGGTCEASVTLSHNIPTVALCVPLGNYHNMNYEGGPQASKKKLGPAPEFVNKKDLRGLLAICEAIIVKGLKNEKDNFKNKRQKMEECLVEYKKELRESISITSRLLHI
jgi:endoglucanase